MTVLVVDDEPQLRLMLANFLEQEGFAVLTAGCGPEAISLFRSHPETDLLITDIVMPGMDGASLAAALQSVNPDLPVLLMSGNCDSKQIDNAFAFLPKPFSLKQLATAVKDALAAAPHACLAVILSRQVFDDVVRQGHVSVPATDFAKVSVEVKEFRDEAWIRVVGVPRSGKAPGSAPAAEEGPVRDEPPAGRAEPEDNRVYQAFYGDVHAQGATFGISRGA